jgi:hypothetical protein
MEQHDQWADPDSWALGIGLKPEMGETHMGRERDRQTEGGRVGPELRVVKVVVSADGTSS